MNVHLTEDEQVEALKKWWAENGKSIIAGVVIGLSAIGGWQAWQNYSRGQSEQASAYYESFRNASQGSELEHTLRQGERLQREFSDTSYADFVALELAKLQYQAGDKDKAIVQLQSVVDQSSVTVTRELAQLRLARLYLDTGDLSAARSLVSSIDQGHFPAERAVIDGDIAMQESDQAAAAIAYSRALTLDPADPSLIEMKLLEVTSQRDDS